MRQRIALAGGFAMRQRGFFRHRAHSPDDSFHIGAHLLNLPASRGPSG
jgi:hypothetical protein